MPHAVIQNDAEAAGLAVGRGSEGREEVIGCVEDEGVLFWWELRREGQTRERGGPCCHVRGEAFWVGAALHAEVGVEGGEACSCGGLVVGRGRRGLSWKVKERDRLTCGIMARARPANQGGRAFLIKGWRRENGID